MHLPHDIKGKEKTRTFLSTFATSTTNVLNVCSGDLKEIIQYSVRKVKLLFFAKN